MKGPPLPRPKVKPRPKQEAKAMNIFEILQSITILTERLQDEVLHLKKELKGRANDLESTEDKEKIIHEVIRYFGAYLVDYCESLFPGGENEIERHCNQAFNLANNFMTLEPEDNPLPTYRSKSEVSKEQEAKRQVKINLRETLETAIDMVGDFDDPPIFTYTNTQSGFTVKIDVDLAKDENVSSDIPETFSLGENSKDKPVEPPSEVYSADPACGCGRESKTPYGYCPYCGNAGVSRERRLNGNDICEQGHTYPSKDSRKNW